MKLQSQISRIYQGIKYIKYWIVVPFNLVKKLGWKRGDNLKAEVKGNKLIIERD